MAFIEQVSNDAARGLLKRIYDAALKRAGRVYNVVRIQGLNPRVLDASLRLYQAITHAPSSLSRSEREMLAVAVSRHNHCFY